LLRVARCGLLAGAFCCAGDDGQTPATIAMAIGIDAHDFQAPLAGTHSSHGGPVQRPGGCASQDGDALPLGCPREGKPVDLIQQEGCWIGGTLLGAMPPTHSPASSRS
jgi:hypothetical protein